MSDLCKTCGRAWPRDFDEIMVQRLVERGRQDGCTREDRWEAIRILLVAGEMTRRDIARHMGVDHKTVMRIANQHQITSVQWNQEEVREMTAEMVRRYESGQSLAQIAYAMNRADSTVKKHLTRVGVQMRPSGWKKNYG